MLQFQEEEKGLFTFYRQQGEQEQLIKQKKIEKKKKRDLARIQQEEKKMTNDERLITQQKNNNLKEVKKLKVKKINTKSFLYQSHDHSVVVVKPAIKRNDTQSYDKTPLEQRLYNPKFKQLPSLQIFVHKSQFPFKNNQTPRQKSVQYNKISLKDYSYDGSNQFVQCINNVRNYEQHKKQLQAKKIIQSQRYNEITSATNINSTIKQILKMQSKILPIINNQIRDTKPNSYRQYKHSSALNSYARLENIDTSGVAHYPVMKNLSRDRNSSRQQHKQIQEKSRRFNFEKDKLIAIIRKMNIGPNLVFD